MKHYVISFALTIIVVLFSLPTLAVRELGTDQEITNLMQNADFRNQFQGWTLTQQGGSLVVQENTQGICEVQSEGCEFTLEQTITDLPDGLYELQIDGYFAAEAMPQSTLHGSMICLNGMKNVLMTSGEYTTENPTNRIVAKPEDGKLTVKIIGLRITSPTDVTVFSNLHLYYRGAGETGLMVCRNVETKMKECAATLLACGSNDITDYRQHPMCQSSLTTDLRNEILNKINYGTVDAMMQHLGKIGSLFSTISESRMAYISLMQNVLQTENTANLLIANELLSEDQYNNAKKVLDNATQGYTAGSLTNQDIESKLKEIAALSGLPKFVGSFMQISTPNDLCSFSVLVNEGMRTLDAQLTKDINMADIRNFQPIGMFSQANKEYSDFYTNSYGGTFDGQGYQILNLNIQTNFEGGLFGRCYRANINKVGLANITVNCTGSQTCGALAGTIMQAQVTNCYVAGKIQVTTNGEKETEFVGEGAWNSVLENCYTLGDRLIYATAAEINNCYGGTDATEAAASGELCYKLNKGETISPIFFQTLRSDAYPVLLSTHEIVRCTSEGIYYKGDDEDAIISIQDSKSKIQDSQSLFDLSGRRLSTKPQKGLYIQGGKVRR